MRKFLGITVLALIVLLLSGCKAKKVVITFDSNGGSPVQEVTLRKGAVLELPEEPKLIGHRFVEWQLDGVKFTDETKVVANITLVAKWEKLKHTITFNPDGGTVVHSLIVEYGDVITPLPTTEKDGSAFDGWYDGDVKIIAPYTVNKDVTLIAKWVIDGKTVSFYADDILIETKAVPQGSTVTPPDVPNKEGFKHVGWLLDDALFDLETPITENIRLDALYEDSRVAVSVEIKEGSSILPAIIEFRAATGLGLKASKLYVESGASFKMFNSMEAFEAYKEEKLTALGLEEFEDIVLVPHIIKDSLSITVIYANAETVSYLEPNTAYDKKKLDKIVYSLTSPEKQVDSWTLESGEAFNPALPLTSSVRIIPVVKIRVTFENGSETIGTNEVPEGSTLGVAKVGIAEPIKPDYIFKGWAKKGETAVLEDTTTFGIHTTLVAIFDEDPDVRNVIWKYPNDAVNQRVSQKKKLGDPLVPPQTPNRPGWTHYYYKLEDGSTLTDTSTVKDNHIITIVYQSDVTIQWDDTKIEYYYYLTKPGGGKPLRQKITPGSAYKFDEGTEIYSVTPLPNNTTTGYTILSQGTETRRLNPTRYKSEGLSEPYQEKQLVNNPEMTVYIDVITQITVKVEVYVDRVYSHDLTPVIVDDILSGQEVQDMFEDQIEALRLTYETDGNLEFDMNGNLADWVWIREVSASDEHTWELYCYSE